MKIQTKIIIFTILSFSFCCCFANKTFAQEQDMIQPASNANVSGNAVIERGVVLDDSENDEMIKKLEEERQKELDEFLKKQEVQIMEKIRVRDENRAAVLSESTVGGGASLETSSIKKDSINRDKEMLDSDQNNDQIFKDLLGLKRFVIYLGFLVFIEFIIIISLFYLVLRKNKV